MFEYLSGNLPRLPKTTIEVYGKIVDQKLIPVSSDLNEKLFEKVGETQDTVQALRSGFSVFSVRSSVAKNTGTAGGCQGSVEDDDCQAGHDGVCSGNDSPSVEYSFGRIVWVSPSRRSNAYLLVWAM